MSIITEIGRCFSQKYANKLRVIGHVNNAIFALFTCSYLMGMQGDRIYVLFAQYFTLSVFYLFLITIAITCGLFFLRYHLSQRYRLNGENDSVSFLPSAALLALLTPSLFAILWSVFLMVVFIVAVRRNLYRRPSSSNAFGGILRTNLLIMIFITFSVSLCGITPDVERYSLAMERNIVEKNYQNATNVGEKSLVTSSQLTALRAYTLDATKALGENLFEYPLVGTSAELIANNNAFYLLDSSYDIPKLHQFPDSVREDIIEQWNNPQLDNINSSDKKSMTLIDRVPRLFASSTTGVANRWRDYRLCALLLDKKIDLFAKELKILYSNVTVLDSLPKHYREALFLYNHIRLHPVIIYSNVVMQTNFSDFSEIQKKNATEVSRNNQARRAYGTTYWWYYFYK